MGHCCYKPRPYLSRRAVRSRPRPLPPTRRWWIPCGNPLLLGGMEDRAGPSHQLSCKDCFNKVARGHMSSSYCSVILPRRCPRPPRVTALLHTHQQVFPTPFCTTGVSQPRPSLINYWRGPLVPLTGGLGPCNSTLVAEPLRLPLAPPLGLF